MINGKNIDYIPVKDFVGTDSFTYIATDGTADGIPVTIDVLANNSDIEGDSLSITNLSTPANKTVMIVVGEVVYTQNKNFNGSDSFTYTPNDVTVLITVLEYTDRVIDTLDLDDDNDGILNVIDGDDERDTDGDNIPDYQGFDVVIFSDVISNVELNTTATVSVFENDKVDAINISTLQITGTENPGDSLVVEGKGVWSIESDGSISFTPEADFVNDPSDMAYSVEDKYGVRRPDVMVTVNYAAKVGGQLIQMVRLPMLWKKILVM